MNAEPLSMSATRKWPTVARYRPAVCALSPGLFQIDTSTKKTMR